jgi:hypothetical protein
MGINYGTYAVPRADLGAAWEEFSQKQEDFIADKVLPVFRTNVKAAKYSALKAESILQDTSAERGQGGGYNRIHTKFADMSYSCEEYGFEHVVGDSERAQFQNDFDADLVATKITTLALLRKRDMRAAALLFNETTWTGADYFLETVVPWSTVATSTPIDDVVFAADKVWKNCGIWPNALILNRTNLSYLLRSAQIRAQFPGAPLVTLEMIQSAIASIFGLTKLIVAGGMKATSDEGLAVTKAAVWSDADVMVAVVPDEGASMVEPAVGRSFLWVPDSPNIVTVEMYRENQVRGDVVRARHNVDEVVHDKNFAFLLGVD